ncbi:hypothetical protein TNCV_2465721 [Trichonephila clavipes]|uniref:Uncharacterized protein n=1 Tax=Trichonephila clavipes TaxID=2585209 RepID=A0A8X6R7R8_TRICX|nr:hypothetical protein TNCV_2465721 [Trichonephila clavipes]
MSSRLVPLKTRRVERYVKSVEAQTASSWWGVEVRRGAVTLPWLKMTMTVANDLRAALEYDVNTSPSVELLKKQA